MTRLRPSGTQGISPRGVFEPKGGGRGGALFDAHLHIIDPRFPMVPNWGYLPQAFAVEGYLERAVPLGVTGGSVVSGSFQGFDQGYLLDALEKLGPSFVGVTQLPASVPNEEVLRLDRAGVRAVRFNLYRGGSADLADLEHLAHRDHERRQAREVLGHGFDPEVFDRRQVNALLKALTRR